MRGVFVAFAAVGTIWLATSSPGGAAGSVDQALVDAINHVRAQHGLPALQRDARLERTARSHSLAILRRGRVAHGNLAARLRREGVRTAAFGENVAWTAGRIRAQQIVGQWLASEVHRTVLLAPDFRRVGIGAVAGRFQGYRSARVVTADFTAG